MKILAEIPHAQLRITLFAWNQKYILKFEQGALEQSYKISELDVTGEAEVLEIAKDEAFLEKVVARFAAMHQDWQELF